MIGLSVADVSWGHYQDSATPCHSTEGLTDESAGRTGFSCTRSPDRPAGGSNRSAGLCSDGIRRPIAVSARRPPWTGDRCVRSDSRYV